MTIKGFEMRKGIIGTVLAMVFVLLAGVSIPFGTSLLGLEPTNAFAATKKSNKKTKPGKKDSVKIDQLSWSVSEGVVDGTEMMTFEYENKSNFDIAQFTVQFEPKGDLTDEQKALFADAFDEGETEHDYSMLKIVADSQRIIEKGDSVDSVPCITHGDFVMNAQQAQYDLMEPSMATIAYLGEDGKVYIEYYNFKSKTYTTSSKGGVKAYDWSTKALAKTLPKPDCPIVHTSFDEKNSLSFTAFGIDHDAYDKYVKDCKKKGYKNISYSYDNSFCAKDKKGRELTLGYSDRDQQMSVNVTND